MPMRLQAAARIGILYPRLFLGNIAQQSPLNICQCVQLYDGLQPPPPLVLVLLVIALDPLVVLPVAPLARMPPGSFRP